MSNRAEVIAAIEASLAVAQALPDDTPPPAPTITNATVTPSVLPFGGGPVTVSADVTNADTVTLNGAPVTLPTTMQVSADTTLELTATGPGGSVSSHLSVDVADAPPPQLPVIIAKPVGQYGIILPGWHKPGGAYTRWEELNIYGGARATIAAKGVAFSSNGAGIAYGQPLDLVLWFTDSAGVRTMAAQKSVLATDTVANFDVDLAPLAGGWYIASVTGGEPRGWTSYEYGYYVDKGTAPPNNLIPVITASYSVTHLISGPRVQHQAWIPSTWNPTTRPLATRYREYPDVVAPVTQDKLAYTQWAPIRPNDVYRPVISRGGVWSTYNMQEYFYGKFSEKYPYWPLLDGPRGKGTLVSLTHVEIGTANVPELGGFIDNIYFTDCWRFGKVKWSTGEVVTLAGWRHKKPSYRQHSGYEYSAVNTDELELVGNWSLIPVARHGFRKVWGLAWNSISFRINKNAAPIPGGERNLKPHITGAEAFVSDSLNNRVCRIKSAKDSHLTPAQVTEFWLGPETWDVVELGAESNCLAISERQGNRIVIINATTAALITSFATTTPEGMYYQDGVLYYGSIGAKHIRKRVITVTTVETPNPDAADVEHPTIITPTVTLGDDTLYLDLRTVHTVNNNSLFVKLAVSDGTFGERGSVAFVTWSNGNYGYPDFYSPTGVRIDYLKLAPGTVMKGLTHPGRSEFSPGYPTSVGIARGRMLGGWVHEGLMQLSAVLPTDQPVPAGYDAGSGQWFAKGYVLTHGERGWGHCGLPLPWGVTPEIDIFLTANGHVRA